jgi:hypothetical protein
VVRGIKKVFANSAKCETVAALMQRQFLSLAVLSLAVFCTRAADSKAEDAPEARVIERGENFAVLEHVKSGGRVTLLENALHYRENGEWKESEDLIEPFPGGAVARRGPNRAIFSEELNSDAVFDIETSGGRRIRGGIRAIQATDFKSGRTVVLGEVKESVKAELFAPNRLVYASAFEGVEADLVLVWKHNLFSHDVIFRERPELPREWDPANVRLEVITEFYVEGEPELRSSVYRAEGQPELRNDAVIHFGSMAMIMGKAFTVGEENAFELGALGMGGIPVVKEWHQAADGRRFLIESLSWAEASEGLKELPVARQAGKTMHESRVKAIAANAVTRPAAESRPVQMAGTSYRPNGYLLDFVIVPDQGTPSNLLSGETYYVRSNYYSGASVTFNPGTVIKFKANASMLVYGPVTFPATNQMMVSFTSRNDDTVGEVVPSNNGEPQSDGDPASHIASATLWLYYNTYNVTVRHARFSWAKNGVLRDRNSGSTASVTLTDCIFNNITNSNSAAFSGDATYLTSARLKKCNVTTAGLTMTTDCEPYVVANFAGLKQSDTGLTTQPPDTQAAAGPTLVMQMIHNNAASGLSGIAFFDKFTGAKKTLATNPPLDTFFATSVQGTNFALKVFDPRLVYDRQSQRWFATVLTYHPSTNATFAILAVSKDSDPVGDGGSGWVTNKWVKHLIEIPGTANDFTTLGIDATGVYVSAFAQNAHAFRLAVLSKSNLLQLTTSTKLSNHIFSVPIPSTNINTAHVAAFAPIVYDGALNDPQWYLCTGESGIEYKKITWSGGVPSIETNWTTLSLTQNGGMVVVDAPHKATGMNEGSLIDTSKVGSRLTTPVSWNVNGVRYIWTCRSVMVNATGGSTDSNRMAIDYIRILASSTPSAANILFYDNSASSPRWYHFPSIAANKSGEILIGCSGSSTNEYIGAYYIARQGSSFTWSPLRPFQLGKDEFIAATSTFRWGDYSATFLDPDGFRIWTMQQFAEVRGSTAPTEWGTRVSVISP